MNPEELFEKHLLNELTPEESGRLKELLADEKTARRFVDYLQEWSVLAAVSRQMASVVREDGRRVRRSTARIRYIPAPPKSRVGWWIAGVAASILFAVGLLLVAAPSSPPPPVAVAPEIPERPVRPPQPPRETPPEAPLPSPPEIVPAPPPTPPPQPEPERRPAPAPAPIPPPAPVEKEPAPAPAPVKPTVVAIAILDRVEGEVHLLGPEGKSTVRAGAAIPPHQGLQTAARRGLAVVKYPDGTLIEVGADSTVEKFTGTGVVLSRGSLSAVVAKQPKPLIFTTPLAEATILGTQFTLVVQPEFTRLDVRDGRVRLARLQDGAAIEVLAGSSAVVERSVKPQALTLLSEFQDGLGGYAGATDTSISGADPSRTFGSDLLLEVDGDEAGNNVYGLLRWDLSRLPAGAVIRSAVITLYVSNQSLSTGYEIYEMKRPWSEAEANWKLAQANKPWRQAGARASQERGTVAVGAVAPRARGETPILLNDHGVALLQSWIRTPASNHGLILANDAVSDGFKFESRESSTPARRPKLVVTYSAGK